jgi:hypothetical protein
MNTYQRFVSSATLVKARVSWLTDVVNRLRWLEVAGRKLKRIEVLGLALLLLPAAIVIASDNFSDVPDSHPFHNAINAIYGARITTGCAPGQYCPDNPVTRGQMAAFMQRGFGRIAYVRGNSKNLTDPIFAPGTTYDLAVLAINTGGAPGGMGFLKVDAALSILYNGTAGCPCEVQFYLSADGGSGSQDYFVTIYNASGVLSNGSGAATLAFPVATGGGTQNVRLRAKLSSTTGAVNANVHARGSISAIYAPFGATGGNSLSAAQEGDNLQPADSSPDAEADHRKMQEQAKQPEQQSRQLEQLQSRIVQLERALKALNVGR